MNNIKSKYYSSAKISKSITRALYSYIVIIIARIMLYVGFRVAVHNDFYVQGLEIFFNFDELSIYTLAAFAIFGVLTLILVLISVNTFIHCIKAIMENEKDAKVGRLIWVYVLLMVADILIGLAFACIAILFDTFALIVISLSVIEVAVLLWLTHVRKNWEG